MSLGLATAHGGDRKFEAQLIWATNDKISPDSKHKPVDEDIRKKLETLPLTWTNYFTVNTTNVTVGKGEAKKIALSEKCSVEVKDVDGKKVEISLFGKKGDVCTRQTEPLAKNKIIVLGGNAPNKTGWLVSVKRTE